MQQFLTILAFYRPFIIWSFIVNIALAVVSPFIVAAIITKLFLTVFVWFLVNETNAKRRLTFFKNLGITPFRLFTSLFIFDVLITISFLVVIKEFI